MPLCTEKTIFDLAQPLLRKKHLHVAKIGYFQKLLQIIFKNVWFLCKVAANDIKKAAKKFQKHLDFLRTRSKRLQEREAKFLLLQNGKEVQTFFIF